jgi:glycosyltransferase involved in cell wall biosynthesis
VTRFTAISRAVAERIRRHYRREARVVHPPVEVERFKPSGAAPEDFYLMVGGFVPYKREALAIEAFRTLGRRLVIVGDGPTRRRLLRRAPANVELPGRVPDAELASLYARCRALIHPQEEDFGIAAVEAQAAGRPVIAFGRGGALETVVPSLAGAEGPGSGEHSAPATGIWFESQTAPALARAVERFERLEPSFDPASIRAFAEGFSTERFHAELGVEIERTLSSRSPVAD